MDGENGHPPFIFVFGEPDGVNAMDVLRDLVIEEFGASATNTGGAQIPVSSPASALEELGDSNSDSSESSRSQHREESAVQELVRHTAQSTTSLNICTIFPSRVSSD